MLLKIRLTLRDCMTKYLKSSSMKKLFFDDNGSLTINESIINHPSYKKILEDYIVTEEELQQQINKVLSLFQKIETEFNDTQKELIKELIIETNILNYISKIYSLNESLE